MLVKIALSWKILLSDNMLRSLETSQSVACVKIAAKSGDFAERGLQSADINRTLAKNFEET